MSRHSFTRPALDLLVGYARYHRDQRNISTHLVGVPMILFAAALLLARPALALPGAALTPVTPAWLAFAALALWTLSRGQFALGLATTLFVGALVWAAHGLVALAEVPVLTVGLSLLVLGSLVQFIGHYYEGRRPASADDLAALFVGPMFVVLELLAMAGLCRTLAAKVERAAGPTKLRDLAQPLPR
ncbi:MAG: Mpo1-like protein [Rubrivivax sp.]